LDGFTFWFLAGALSLCRSTNFLKSNDDVQENKPMVELAYDQIHPLKKDRTVKLGRKLEELETGTEQADTTGGSERLEDRAEATFSSGTPLPQCNRWRCRPLSRQATLERSRKALYGPRNSQAAQWAERRKEELDTGKLSRMN
jgi:hypothetical protein